MPYLLEIKNRLLIICGGTILVTVILFLYKETLLFIILKPTMYQNTSLYLICTNITEGFMSYWYLVTIFCFHFFIIFLIIHAYFFMVPGIYQYEKKLIQFYLFIYLNFLLFLILIFYKILLPCSWDFFYKIISVNANNVITQQKTIKLFFEIKINEYLDFFFKLYFFCILLAQVFFVLSIKLNDVYKKSKFTSIKFYRKRLYFLFFILSTLITPPDVISQLIIGGIFILMLEVTIFVIILKNQYNDR